MPKKKKPYNLTRKIVVELRAIHRGWPNANQCIRNATVGKGKSAQVKCSGCKALFRKELIKKDHIDPIGEEPELIGTIWAPSWDTYINKFFSPIDNYQALCVYCHDKKTEFEKNVRKEKKNAKSNDAIREEIAFQKEQKDKAL